MWKSHTFARRDFCTANGANAVCLENLRCLSSSSVPTHYVIRVIPLLILAETLQLAQRQMVREQRLHRPSAPSQQTCMAIRVETRCFLDHSLNGDDCKFTPFDTTPGQALGEGIDLIVMAPGKGQ